MKLSVRSGGFCGASKVWSHTDLSLLSFFNHRNHHVFLFDKFYHVMCVMYVRLDTWCSHAHNMRTRLTVCSGHREEDLHLWCWWTSCCFSPAPRLFVNRYHKMNLPTTSTPHFHVFSLSNCFCFCFRVAVFSHPATRCHQFSLWLHCPTHLVQSRSLSLLPHLFLFLH